MCHCDRTIISEAIKFQVELIVEVLGKKVIVLKSDCFNNSTTPEVQKKCLFVRTFIEQRKQSAAHKIIVLKLKHRQRSLTKQIFYEQLRKSYRKCLKSQLNSTIYLTLTEKTWLAQADRHQHRRRFKSFRPSQKHFHTCHPGQPWN